MKPRTVVIVAVSAAALAFMLGRSTAPVVVEERILETSLEETSSSVEKAEERQVEATTETVRVVYRDRVVHPDGTIRESEMERTETATQLREQAAAVEVRHEETVRVELREVERVVEAPLPDWRLSGLVGLDVMRGVPTYGAHLERRLWGPVTVGAWGISTGAMGVAVGAEW